MPAVWLFPSVVTTGGGRLRGRALRRDPDRGFFTVVRNTRSIVFSPELPRAAVRVSVCGRLWEGLADDEGFFTVPLEGPMPIGTHDVEAFVGGEDHVAGRGHLHVVPPEGLSVVSDLDDTIAISHIGRKFRMVWNALMRDEKGHRAVTGMAALYRRLAATAASFHYVSGTPVGLLRRTERFMLRHGFPAGALLLRHWETEGLDISTFKPRVLGEIVRALPGHRFVLVGDSGEKDPEFFTALRTEVGERIAAVLVRRVTPEPRDAPRFAGMIVFDEAEEAADALSRLGLITA
jgi:phosphatidate phosphatase APP1